MNDNTMMDGYDSVLNAGNEATINTVWFQEWTKSQPRLKYMPPYYLPGNSFRLYR